MAFVFLLVTLPNRLILVELLLETELVLPDAASVE